jgi:hypothetical protein
VVLLASESMILAHDMEVFQIKVAARLLGCINSSHVIELLDQALLLLLLG